MNAPNLPFRVLTAVLVLGCTLDLMHVICIIGLHVPFDPNEGWNAYFTQAVLATGSPYPPANSLMINNYPPLSFYLIAGFSRLVGDVIVSGRIVALVSLFAVALGIETAARRMGCTRLEALFAALLFTAGLMLTTDYVGMDDPQILGHAIDLGGLLLVLREPRTSRLMVAAALLFVLAFFVKHNLVVLPAALAVWLLLADRRHAGTFIASGVVFLLLGLGLFRQVYGVDLLSQIASARSYSLANIGTGLAQWLPWAAIPTIGAAALFLLARRDRYAVLAAIYAMIATISGIFFLGGAGVDANALFDADIALALCAGLLMNRLQLSVPQGIAALLYAIPLAIGLRSLDTTWCTTDYWLHPLADERRTADDEIALIQRTPGPVLCEMLSLCYWGGKPAEVDVFNSEQAYMAGARSDAELVNLVQEKHFALVQFEQFDPFPLTPGIHHTLLQNYQIVRSDGDRVFFAPR